MSERQEQQYRRQRDQLWVMHWSQERHWEQKNRQIPEHHLDLGRHQHLGIHQTSVMQEWLIPMVDRQDQQVPENRDPEMRIL
jgi:hypothetical protein